MVIGIQRHIDQPVAADRQRPVPPRGRWGNDLRPRAAGQGCRQHRALAVDPLMGLAGNLLGQPLDQPVVDLRCFMADHAANARRFQPDLAGAVDQNFGDRVVIQPGGEWFEMRGEIDAAASRHSRRHCSPPKNQDRGR